MLTLPFDSHDINYKSTLSAAAEDEVLRLRLLLHNDAHCDSAFILITPDGEDAYSLPLTFSGRYDDNYVWWEIGLSLKEGLYWYSFYYFGTGGRHCVTRFENGRGLVSDGGRQWQLTVYSKDFSTPDWPADGIIYQIFPDRFMKSGAMHPGIPDGRFLRDDWGGVPAYINDGSEFSLCNDYFGGDLEGIRSKLPYLRSLGVSCIYLNPIFEAHSNHRYNTADYMKIDPLLGDDDDFRRLCLDAGKLGIGIILDGVFSHTGSDSRYFNRSGRYGNGGAYNDENSPYRSWYKFDNSAVGYHSWWGVPTLPEVNENDPAFDEFINGEDGVVRHWLRAGARGFRLDVADELPDLFLDNLRSAAKAESADNFILGEVWEDATNKISYGFRRRFLRGKQLDSVMNYPFRNAIIDFVKGGDAEKLLETVADILENYPPQAVKLLMNHIGTHDTPRILTVLSDSFVPCDDRAWQSTQKLGDEEYKTAVRRLKMAAVLQYTLPGIPSLYYGDEAGLYGYGDPFCRGCFPWDSADGELTEFYRRLGQMRYKNPVFGGEFIPVCSDLGYLVFLRRGGGRELLAAVNRWREDAEVFIGEKYDGYAPIFGSASRAGVITIPAYGFVILQSNLNRN